MAGRREVGIVSSLLWACAWLCFDSVARADDGEGGGFELPCGYATTTILPQGANMQKIVLEDMNESGVAVGYAEIGLDYRSCLWSKSAGIVLLPEPWWVAMSYGQRINNNGWILVNGSGQKTRGYVLIPNGGGGYDTVEIEPASAVGWSKAYGINDKNEVVGLQSMGTPGGDPVFPVAGFKWSEELGKETILVPGYVSTQCNDINDDGVICGTTTQSPQATIGDGSARGFIRARGEIQVIEPVAPFTKSEAVRVSGEGTVIGSMRTQGGGGPSDYDGWRKRLDEPIPTLIPSPPGTWGWLPRDINDAGLIGGDVVVTPGSGGIRYAALHADQGFSSLAELLGFTIGQTTFASLLDDGTLLVYGCNCAGCSCLSLMEPSTLIGDLDCDGGIGAVDLGVLVQAWGAVGDDEPADLDRDGTVDGTDLGMLLTGWTE